MTPDRWAAAAYNCRAGAQTTRLAHWSPNAEMRVESLDAFDECFSPVLSVQFLNGPEAAPSVQSWMPEWKERAFSEPKTDTPLLTLSKSFWAICARVPNSMIVPSTASSQCLRRKMI